VVVKRVGWGESGGVHYSTNVSGKVDKSYTLGKAGLGTEIQLGWKGERRGLWWWRGWGEGKVAGFIIALMFQVKLTQLYTGTNQQKQAHSAGRKGERRVLFKCNHIVIIIVTCIHLAHMSIQQILYYFFLSHVTGYIQDTRTPFPPTPPHTPHTLEQHTDNHNPGRRCNKKERIIDAIPAVNQLMKEPRPPA
jgi:hypothetical protein